ncbi:complex I subunit 5 family protein [Xylanimonas ulmi]|uniref:Multisubunit sodium/proton antiporter MrpD subunit n=1 Tax=Xylanimonas ulmi TaxID=228973 RepID=A0A4Q7M2W3_9MICO|nr:proton-conducting transporter membrane subunit [Xylanibacterium ulmi]RZS60818.1 multisubunit sodium/proton antiporter MrpD subunit [Xylanibacterium ulmi]
MVALVLLPVLLGVALYKAPTAPAKALAFAGQGWLAWRAVTLLARTVREGPTLEVLGGGDGFVYIALRGERAALALVVLTVVLVTAALAHALGEPYFDNRLLLLLLVLQGLVAGVLLTDDVFNLFVLFEVATLTTILLVMFKRDRRNTYDGLYYLMVQIVAMTFFLFGLAYLYRVFGVLSVTEIAAMVGQGVDGRALVAPFAFMVTGLALKAGLFPLFSFVPRSYANPGAPTVVLMLMSGVLVTAALFWVARLVDLFAPALDVSGFLAVVGLVTGVAGAAKALAQRDIRLLLAYSTVSQAGLVTLGLAAGTAAASGGAIAHLANHALAKSALFLTAAAIGRRYGSVRLDEIRGVARRMPLVTALSAVAVLGMLGAPFTGGAWSKDLIASGAAGTWVEAAVWVVNIGTALVFVRYCAMFFGTPPPPLAPAAAPAPTRAVRLGQGAKVGVVVALTLACLATGVLAVPTAHLLLGADVAVSAGTTAAKAAAFAATIAVALLAHRYLGPAARRLRAPLTRTLSLPYACLALTVFFAATALAGSIATRGVAG